MEAEDHPLDIKLRADLLGKRLLFIGYSFRDENVTKLLSSVQRAVAGQLPSSYLLAFDYDPSMDDLLRSHGLRVINPRQLWPAGTTNAEAFERCLKELCDRTINLQANRGFETLLSGGEINPRIATVFEVDAIAKAVKTEPFETALSAFRAVFDQSLVPTSLQRRVTDTFCCLILKANPGDNKQMRDLKGALFNFHLPPAFAIEALSSLMAISNRRPLRDGFDDFISLQCPALPDGLDPVAAALAVTLLADRGEAITDNFRHLAIYWFRSSGKRTLNFRS